MTPQAMWSNGGAVIPQPLPPKRDRSVFLRGDHPELGKALLEDLRSDAPPIYDEGILHTYSDRTGTWTPVPDPVASRIVQGYALGGAVARDDRGRDKALRLKASDVAGALKMARDQADDHGFFSRAPHGITFKNGFLVVDGTAVKLCPLSPENGARCAFLFDYDAHASCPMWLAYIDGAFRGDVDAREKVAAVQEFLGAMLLGLATRFNKAMLVKGERDAGKSTLLKIASGLAPSGSVCTAPPQGWGSEYNRHLLKGALLNVVHELPEGDVMAADSFKAIIEGQPIQVRLPCGVPHNIAPRAAHLWAINGFLGTKDHSEAFYKRWLPIEFNRRIPERDKVRGLAEKILKEELSGLIAWAVKGAVRLLRQNAYTVPSSSKAFLQSWKRDADPVATFIAEKTRPCRTESERAPASEVFEAFCRWSEANKFAAMNVRTFGLRMTSLGLQSRAAHGLRTYPIAMLVRGESAPDEDIEREAIEEQPVTIQ